MCHLAFDLTNAAPIQEHKGKFNLNSPSFWSAILEISFLYIEISTLCKITLDHSKEPLLISLESHPGYKFPWISSTLFLENLPHLSRNHLHRTSSNPYLITLSLHPSIQNSSPSFMWIGCITNHSLTTRARTHHCS